MNFSKRVIASVLGATLLFSAVSCSEGTPEDRARNALQAQKATGPTLEKANLEEKRKREENPNAIGYIYLYAFNQPIGYYISKGKISSNGSQATPEQDIHWTCGGSSGYYGCSPVVVDGPQDDGSYGGTDPGVFFFLSDGTKVVTSLSYIHSDRPIPVLNVPLFGGEPR